MPDPATKKKRTALSLGVAGFVALWPLAFVRAAVDDGGGAAVSWLLGLLLLACLLAFVVGVPWAAFLYWRDWYRS